MTQQVGHDALVLSYIMRIAEQEGLGETKQVIERAKVLVERDLWMQKAQDGERHLKAVEEANADEGK